MQGNVVVQHLAGKMRERVCGELIGSAAKAAYLHAPYGV